ncbi:tetratricopeptide repeat protein [Psychromonas sp. KJ10-10]|uniref:tetratricopeptide repeat protein n=1 Tax=Psychromonas sp. KJ10-10 TaxID=3391823 RepID=UPI0039B66DE2
MQQGNKHYHMDQWDEALSYYHEAIELLESIDSIDSGNAQKTLQAWVCGYHNLASTYEKQGFIERRRDALVTPFRIMLALTNNSQSTLEMQMFTYRALQMTIPPLLEFANTYPSEVKFIKQLIGSIESNKQLH